MVVFCAINFVGGITESLKDNTRVFIQLWSNWYRSKMGNGTVPTRIT